MLIRILLSTSYTLLYIFFLYLLNKFIVKLETSMVMLEEITLLISFSVLVGVYLSLPTLIKKIKSQGTWKANWIQLMCVAIPLGFITLNILLFFYSPLGNSWSPIGYVYNILFYSNWKIILIISGIGLGFFLSDSFYKEEHPDVICNKEHQNIKSNHKKEG